VTQSKARFGGPFLLRLVVRLNSCALADRPKKGAGARRPLNRGMSPAEKNNTGSMS